jgi:gamma-glutamylcyclotransferase (GGCT)/AIG2-like uncharacterized protein YtfP
MNRLFCYGTLQVPQIIRAVTGRIYQGMTATLHGYAIYRVKNAEYPGIIRIADRETEGIVYDNLSAKDLNVLDLFEGDFYRRQLLDVRLSGGSNSKAWVYVVADNHKDILSDESWCLENFMDNGLESFMKGYVNGRRNVYSCKEI